MRRSRAALLLGVAYAAVVAAQAAPGGSRDVADAAPVDERPEAPIGVDFVTDVQPVLTRAGCNTGECHGAALGQNRFRLSLSGYDARADWEALARELRGRRIDTVEPERSLILRKPSLRTDHEGGEVLPEDGEGYAIVREWIRAGAPFRTTERALEDLVLASGEVDGKERLSVTALYDDGTRRDVTRFARFASNDPSVAFATEDGVILRSRPGRTAVVVRYGGAIAVHPVRIPFGEVGDGALAEGFEPVNFVDGHVLDHFTALGKPLPDDCTDRAFVRRVTLDLTGRLPSPAEVERFVADPDRAALVDRLVASPAFVENWAYRLAEAFPESPGLVVWLREQLAEDAPWDAIATRMMTARGEHPGTALFVSNDPKEIGERVFQGFLGQRIHCAQCHNHPFDSFTRRDYFSVAAFFARTRIEGGGLTLADRGEVRWPDTSDLVEPAYPGGRPATFDDGADDDGADRRAPLAGWVVERPEFSRLLANRVWAVLMGQGLVEPVDDLRASNPPWSGPLLDALADDFDAHGRSLRRLVSTVAKSAAYGRLKEPERLPAAVLVDALADVTGVPDRGRAVAAPAQPSETLDVSGRRTDFEGSLAQSLHLVVSDAINAKLPRMERVDLDTLFLRAYARPATPAERSLEPGSREAFEDLVWAVLNSEEFLYVR